jgi:Activator of Hsp90 ATPase homolog 1-like protein
MDELAGKAGSGGAERAAIEPIVVTVPLGCPPERAFAYFTRDIATWWPLATHSVCADRAATVAFEPRSGGRLFETDREGNVHIWGLVSEWNPPGRLRFSWHPGHEEATAQWVEVTFVPNPKGTLVTLTHGGWEALGERAMTTRTNYSGGWPKVIGTLFANYVRGAADESPPARR